MIIEDGIDKVTTIKKKKKTLHHTHTHTRIYTHTEVNSMSKQDMLFVSSLIRNDLRVAMVHHMWWWWEQIND
jgi:hypothetical protein